MAPSSFYMPAKGRVREEGDEAVATGHGSLQPYDHRIPVIVLPPGRTRHAEPTGPDTTTLPMQRIAPMLAGWLGVPPPTSLTALTAP